MSFARFLDGLPEYLAAKDFRAVVGAVARARRRGAPVLLGIGAHFIKVASLRCSSRGSGTAYSPPWR
jgi:hypothetical protein